MKRILLISSLMISFGAYAGPGEKAKELKVGESHVESEISGENTLGELNGGINNSGGGRPGLIHQDKLMKRRKLKSRHFPKKRK